MGATDKAALEGWQRSGQRFPDLARPGELKRFAVSLRDGGKLPAFRRDGEALSLQPGRFGQAQDSLVMVHSFDVVAETADEAVQMVVRGTGLRSDFVARQVLVNGKPAAACEKSKPPYFDPGPRDVFIPFVPRGRRT